MVIDSCFHIPKRRVFNAPLTPRGRSAPPRTSHRRDRSTTRLRPRPRPNVTSAVSTTLARASGRACHSSTCSCGRSPCRPGESVLGEVLGGVRVTDEDRVVAARERAVDRRADAGIGLRPGDDEPSDSRWRARPPSVVSSNESPYCLWTSGSDSWRWSSGTYCQPSLFSGRSSWECCTQITGTCRRGPCRPGCRCWRSPRHAGGRWPPRRSAHPPPQRGVRTVAEAGHARLLLGPPADASRTCRPGSSAPIPAHPVRRGCVPRPGRRPSEALNVRSDTQVCVTTRTERSGAAAHDRCTPRETTCT